MTTQRLGTDLVTILSILAGKTGKKRPEIDRSFVLLFVLGRNPLTRVCAEHAEEVVSTNHIDVALTAGKPEAIRYVRHILLDAKTTSSLRHFSVYIRVPFK